MAKPNNSSYLSDQQRAYFAYDYNKKQDFCDPWSTQLIQQDLSASEQLTASTTSTTASEPNLFVSAQKPTQLDSNNPWSRMPTDTQICGGQSQQHQRIMRQYAMPDDLTENRLFSGGNRADDIRALLNDHSSETTLFAAFQPLPASGAVH